jgi:hypothetical protein
MNQTSLIDDNCYKQIYNKEQEKFLNYRLDPLVNEHKQACFINNSNFIPNKKDTSNQIDIDTYTKGLKTKLNKCESTTQSYFNPKPLIFCDKNILKPTNSRNKKSNNFPKTQINRFYQFPDQVSNFIGSSQSKIGMNTRLLYKS